jgi:GDPmannose 4,6-dehydratase
MSKKALITGASGMDASNLAEILLAKDYEVYGTVRRTATPNTQNIVHLLDNKHYHLIESDVTDPVSVNNVCRANKYDEVYLLAGQSHVQTSFDQPFYTYLVNYNGIVNFLTSLNEYNHNAHVYFASTSETFGKAYSVDNDGQKYQDEQTEMLPQSPYAIAKLAAFHLCRIYRESYNMFVCCGILFNHTGERRGENFITRKISKYVAYAHKQQILGLKIKPLFLGNLDAIRDFGYSPDFCLAMWKMLQQDKSDDYVVATGIGYSIKELLSYAFNVVGMDWTKYVKIDESLKRPSEVEFLTGRADKAKRVLGWEPTVPFEEIVHRMVINDIKLLEGKLN